MMNQRFRNTLILTLFALLLSVCSGETTSSPKTPASPAGKHFVNTTEIASDPDLDAMARIMAGLEPASSAPEAWKTIAASAAFAAHKQQLGASFSRAEKSRLSIMKQWSAEELADVCKEANDLFYPFSGPDIMTAHAIFPCAKDYIMIGLEPAGIPPALGNMNEAVRARYFAAVRNSLGSILNYSFFRTNDMRDDFRGVLDGLTPILMVFLAREGNELVAARVATMLPDGTISERDPKKAPSAEERKAEATGVPGIRFYFKDVKDGRLKTVTYFSVDISDTGLANRAFFLETIGRTGTYTTYLKSASYLMHRDSFSKIRSFILDNSDHVIQDDSGMPLAFFPEGKWNRSFYGMYTQPIPLFASRYQPDLRAIYKDPVKNGVKKLPFGTGYNFKEGDSHLLVARKKK